MAPPFSRIPHHKIPALRDALIIVSQPLAQTARVAHEPIPALETALVIPEKKPAEEPVQAVSPAELRDILTRALSR